MTGASGAVGGPIVRKDTAERIVTAPVLVPNEPDRERHWYSPENIEEVATGFLPNGGGVDAMHLGGESGYPIESYLAPQELSFGQRTVPEGTWMVSMRVTDDEVWRGVETGEYQGVSVEGPIQAVYDESGEQLPLEEIAVPVGTPMNDRPPEPALANALGSGAELTLPPAPVGETWQVVLRRADFVSIVDDPAIQKATFVVAKRQGATRGGSGSGGTGTPIMDDDFKERFDELETLVQKSAEAAEGAQESAQEATETANDALEAAEGDDGGGDGGGGDGEGGNGSNGGSEGDLADQLTDRFDELNARLDELEGEGDDPQLDQETVDQLIEAGVIDEEDAEDLNLSGDAAIEKRLASIEKSLNSPGRRGRATLLDGEDDESGVGSGNIGSAIAGGEEGDD